MKQVLLKFKGLTLMLMLMVTASGAMAAVTVTPANNGTGITADNAGNAATPAFTTLSTITIREANGSNGDFSTGVTQLVLTMPSGWSFGTAANITATITNSPKDITVGAITLSGPTNNIATIALTVSGTANRDLLSIVAKIQNTDGSTLTQSGNIIASFTGTINGMVSGTTSLGAISQKAGALAKFALPQAIPNQNEGTAFSFGPITAQDQFGSTLSTANGNAFTGTPTISITSGTPAPTTSTAFTNGVLTSQSITINTAGIQTITFTSGGKTGASNSFTVATGALSKFAVTITAAQVSGTPFSVTITAQDNNGNTITGYTGTPALTVSNSLSISPTTSIAFTSGVATQPVTLLGNGPAVKVTATDGAVTGSSAAFITTANWYSGTAASLDLTLASSWNSNADGTSGGAMPNTVMFSNGNAIFHIQNSPSPNVNTNWTISGTGSNVIVGNGTAACPFTIGGTAAVTAPIDISNNGSVILSTTGSITGINFGTLNANSTVNYASTGPQTITADNFGNLTSSSTGARTLASSGTIGVSGTFSPGANAYTITGSTINFNGANGQTIPAFNYNSLSSSNNSRTLSQTGTIGIAGTFTPGTGAYTVTNSTVSFSGTSTIPAPTPVAGGTNYNNFNVTGGTSTMGASFTIGGDLTLTGGTFVQNTGSSFTLTMNGNIFLNGGNYNLGNNFGSGPLVLKGNITENNAASVFTSSSTFGSGTLSLSGAGTVANPQTISFAHPANHPKVLYSVASGTVVKLLSQVSLTVAASGGFPGATTFTVSTGGTLDVGSINGAVYQGTTQGGTAVPTFTLSTGATLRTANLGGVTASIPATNMTRTMNAGANYVFYGSGPQNTGFVTTPTQTLAALTINNSFGVTMTEGATLSGALTFTAGKIITNNHALTLGTASTVTGASATSYVVVGNGIGTTAGTLVRTAVTGTANGFFPMGTATYYLPATVTSSASATFTGYVFTGVTTNGAANGTQFSDKSGAVDAVWNLTSTSTNATIKLDWSNAVVLEGSRLAAWPPTSNAIGISHFTGGAWQAATGSGNNSTHTATANFTSFSPFSIGSIGAPLPVTLSQFDASLNSDNTTNITWTTDIEVNSAYFNVLRSTNGVDYTSISSVTSHGNSSVQNHYQYTDPIPVTGVTYYRLQMVDLDGSSKYSEIKVVRPSAVTSISIFPNPARNFVNVSLGMTISKNLVIRLISQNGQLLQQKTVTNGAGTTISLPVSQYAEGMYLLQLIGSDGTSQSHKIIIGKQ